MLVGGAFDRHAAPGSRRQAAAALLKLRFGLFGAMRLAGAARPQIRAVLEGAGETSAFAFGRLPANEIFLKVAL